jgi:hypothetical protein
METVAGNPSFPFTKALLLFLLSLQLPGSSSKKCCCMKILGKPPALVGGWGEVICWFLRFPLGCVHFVV